MAKQKKDRKISPTDRAFYKLGFQDGEQQLKKTLNVLTTTNRELWDELVRLDKTDPIEDEILIPTKMVERIIRALKKPLSNFYLAGKIQEIQES